MSESGAINTSKAMYRFHSCHLLRLLVLLVFVHVQSAMAAPNPEQARQFLQQHRDEVVDYVQQNRGEIEERLRSAEGQRVLNSTIDVLLIDDQATANQYVTTLHSSGGILGSSRPPVLFGARHLSAGNRRFLTWYPHDADDTIESMTAVAPVSAFRGLANEHGNIIGGSRRVELPDGSYVNPVLSDTAFDFLSDGVLGAERRLSLIERQSAGRRRLVTANVRKQAELTLQRPPSTQCSAQSVEGADGVVCTLRQVSAQANGSVAGGMQFTVNDRGGSRGMRFGVGGHWYEVGHSVPVAELANSGLIEVFVPAHDESRRALPGLTLKFFNPARQSLGDAYVSSVLAGIDLSTGSAHLMSRADVVYIKDDAEGDEYVFTQGRHVFNTREALAPWVEGARGKSHAGRQAEWVLSDSLDVQHGAELGPSEWFSGIAENPLISDAGWQWFADSAPGDLQLLRYQAAEGRVQTQLRKLSQLHLSSAPSQCHVQRVHGESGQVCMLRRVDSRLSGDVSGIRFRITDSGAATFWRVGNDWRAVGVGAPLGEFLGAQSLEVFIPEGLPVDLRAITFEFGTGTMADDGDLTDEPISITSVSSPVVTEREELVYTVTLSRAVQANDPAVTVKWDGHTGEGYADTDDAYIGGTDGKTGFYYEDGTSKKGVNLVSGQRESIPVGTDSFDVRIWTKEDPFQEPSEILTIMASAGGSSDWVAGTATIEDNDDLLIEEVSSPAVTEGGQLVYTVTLNRAIQPDGVEDDYVVVQWDHKTGAGYADASDAYLGGTDGETGFYYEDGTSETHLNLQYATYAHLPAGTDSFEVRIWSKQDNLFEPEEALGIEAYAMQGSTSGVVVTGVGRITDDDDQSVSAVSSPTAREGEPLKYQVILDREAQPADSGIRVKWDGTIGEGQADTNDVDFRSVSFIYEDGSSDSGLTLLEDGAVAAVPAGTNSFTVSIPTKQDVLLEPSEALTIMAATDGTSGWVSGAGTLTDDDALSITGVSSPAVTEGEGLVYTVTLSRAVQADDPNVIVTWDGHTGEGYADTSDAYIGGADGKTGFYYEDGTSDQAANLQNLREASVPVGTDSFEVRVMTKEDIVREPSETLTFLVKPVGASDWTSGTGTITDDDALSITGVSSPTVNEGGELVYTVTLSRAVQSNDPSVMIQWDGRSGTGYADTSDAYLDGADGKTGFYFENGTSETGVDLQSSSSVSVPVGTDSFDVRVWSKPDQLLEPDEVLGIEANVAQTSDVVRGVGTIVNVDALSILYVGSPILEEGKDLVYMVALNRAYAAGDHVHIKMLLSQGTTSADDLQLSAVELSNGASGIADLREDAVREVAVDVGASNFWVTVPSVDDSIEESEETAVLSVDAQDDTWVTGTGTLKDNDEMALEVTSLAGGEIALEGQDLVNGFEINRPARSGDVIILSLLGDSEASAADVKAVYIFNTSTGAWQEADGYHDRYVTFNMSDGALSADSSNLLRITTVEDSISEGDEDLHFELLGMYQVGQPVDALDTISERAPEVTLSVTPQQDLQFTYGEKTGFGAQTAAFDLQVDGIEGASGLRLETRAGSEHQVAGPGGSHMSVELMAGSQVLSTDSWLTLLGDGVVYPGLGDISTSISGSQTAASSFIARMTDFNDGQSAVSSAEEMPDGDYSGSVAAEFRVLWEP